MPEAGAVTCRLEHEYRIVCACAGPCALPAPGSRGVFAHRGTNSIGERICVGVLRYPRARRHAACGALGSRTPHRLPPLRACYVRLSGYGPDEIDIDRHGPHPVVVPTVLGRDASVFDPARSLSNASPPPPLTAPLSPWCLLRGSGPSASGRRVPRGRQGFPDRSRGLPARGST